MSFAALSASSPSGAPFVAAPGMRRRGAVFGAMIAALVVGIGVGVGGSRAGEVAGPRERLEVVTARGAVAFAVEVMADDESRARGLMYRTEMAADQGMLFDFRREQPVWFWMKNTYLPLDMIFARADGTILSIAENTTPLSEAMVPSGGPVRFVLEVNAGASARAGIKPGDRLVHPRVRAGQ